MALFGGPPRIDAISRYEQATFSRFMPEANHWLLNSDTQMFGGPTESTLERCLEHVGQYAWLLKPNERWIVNYTACDWQLRLGRYLDAIRAGDILTMSKPLDPRSHYARATVYRRLSWGLEPSIDREKYAASFAALRPVRIEVVVLLGALYNPEKQEAALREISLTYDQAAQIAIDGFREALARADKRDREEIDRHIQAIKAEIRTLR